MYNEIVKSWFGDQFEKLHPELQKLHLDGGILQGTVQIVYGNGLAGVVGHRLAQKLNVPEEGSHAFSVTISHHSDGLHWDRCFDHSTEMKSTFTPIGVIDDGCWVEQSGPLRMRLTVDIKDGGWYWRCLNFQFLRVPIPAWLFPKSKAYKTIEDGLYRFYVGFSLPVLGNVLSYSGLLKAKYSE